MIKRLIFSPAVLFAVSASAGPPAPPNDCWFGVMGADSPAHGRLVATGPVAQWRVGAPVVFYATIEDEAQINALAEQGKTGTFDTTHPITVIPIEIFAPEPGDKDNQDEAKSIEITLKYRTTQGETGSIFATYWTPAAGNYTSLPPEQQATMIQVDWMQHDTLCRGIP